MMQRYSAAATGKTILILICLFSVVVFISLSREPETSDTERSVLQTSGRRLTSRPPVRRLNLRPRPRQKHIDPSSVAGCFASKRIRRVAFLGDSQAPRYMRALQQLLPKPCGTVIKERTKDREPEAAFYCREANIRNCNLVVTSSRACSGCSSQRAVCGPLVIDHYVMEFLRDNEITFHLDQNHSDPLLEECQVLTTQEFILRILWGEKRRRPDLIIIFATIVHDMARSNETTYRQDLKWLLDKFNSHLVSWKERNTQIIFLNSPFVREDKVPSRWRTVTTNNRVRAFNKILSDEYSEKTFFSPDIFLEPPVNLSSASENISKDSYSDAVHFGPNWYNNIMRNFLLEFCS